jgi:hypothetical protein
MNAARISRFLAAILLALVGTSCVTETTRTTGGASAEAGERLEPVKVAEWVKPVARKARPRFSTDKAYVGIVHRVPPDGIGLWMIGSQTFESDSFTMLDTFRAPMIPGNCAAVVMRASHAARIIFFEPQDC